jgi:hypothetical protein
MATCFGLMSKLLPVKRNPSIGIRTERQNFYNAVPTSTLINNVYKNTYYIIIKTPKHVAM